MGLIETYYWEMETSNGQVLLQYNPDGSENSWKKLDTETIMRVTFRPRIASMPAHTCFIDLLNGERFIRRFARNFKKSTGNGFKDFERINCVVTNRYRFWVFSDGTCWTTERDFEVYI